MIKLFVQNSLCLVLNDKSYETKLFMHNYFTSVEPVKQFNRGGRARTIDEERPMYREVVYDGVEYYQVPRGLIGLLPGEAFSYIEWKDYSTHELIDPSDLSYSHIAESLRPEASFDLRKDQVAAVSKGIQEKHGVLQLPTGCFTSDTKVRTYCGSNVSIDRLLLMKEQGKVYPSLAVIDESGHTVEGTISDIIHTKDVTDLYSISVNHNKLVEVTGNHPVLTSVDAKIVEGKIVYDYTYTPVDQLSINDPVMINYDDSNSIYSGRVTCIKKVHYDDPVPVYDIKMIHYHNYQVVFNDSYSDSCYLIVHNSGKTEIMSSIIKLMQESNPNMKTLVIEPTGVLRDGTTRRFNGYNIDAKTYNDTRHELTSDVTVAHTAALLNDLKADPLLLKDVTTVFWDECLPSYSQILLPSGESVDISEVYDNPNYNEVVSYNDQRGLVSRRIIRKIKALVKSDDKWVEVKYTDPLDPDRIYKIRCTSNHKIYTSDRGYVEAGKLVLNDLIYRVVLNSQYSYFRPSIRYLELANPKTGMIEKVARAENKYYESKVYENESQRVVSVISVEEIPDQYTYKYNLETEQDHNYVADNVLVSNCHHLKADSWNTLNMSLPNIEMNISLSALAIDEKNLDVREVRKLSYPEAQVVGVSGPVIYHVPVKYYIENGILARPVVMQVYNQVHLSDANKDKGNVWAVIRKEGLESKERTDLTADVTHMFTKNGRKVLILVGTKSQGNSIAKTIGDTYPELQGLIGILYGGGEALIYGSENFGGNPKLYGTDKDVLDMYAKNDLVVMIATSHMDEGVDIKNLDAVILAGGGRKDRRIVQRVGRVLRKTKNGKYAYVIDFTDTGDTALGRQSYLRMEMFENLLEIDPRYIFRSVTMDRLEYEFNKLESID